MLVYNNRIAPFVINWKSSITYEMTLLTLTSFSFHISTIEQLPVDTFCNYSATNKTSK